VLPTAPHPLSQAGMPVAGAPPDADGGDAGDCWAGDCCVGCGAGACAPQAGAAAGACGCAPHAGVGACQPGAGALVAFRGGALTGSGGTVSPRMIAACCGSSGRTTFAIRFWSRYWGLEAGSTMIRAAKTMPSRCLSPGSTRLALASGLSSLGSSPRALSTIARKVDFEIFQPID